jgi:hypothetical protein
VVGLGIAEPKQREVLRSIELGDDTRRPAAELSRARIEQNRTREACGRIRFGVGTLCHYD